MREALRWLLHRPLLMVVASLSLAVAGLAYQLLAVNADIIYLAHGDPDELVTLADARAAGLNIYTSGFACGQLLSFLFGAGFVVFDQRPGRVLRTRLLTALGCGSVLALSDLAVVLTAAPARALEVWHQYDPSLPPGGDLLHDPAIRCAVVLGVVGFPLWAALGVGTGALLAGWPTLTGPIFAGGIVTTYVLSGAAGLHSTAWASLAVALLPPPVLPPSTLLGLIAAAYAPYRIPVAIAGTAGSVLYTTLLYYAGRAALQHRAALQSRVRTALRSG